MGCCYVFIWKKLLNHIQSFKPSWINFCKELNLKRQFSFIKVFLSTSAILLLFHSASIPFVFWIQSDPWCQRMAGLLALLPNPWNWKFKLRWNNGGLVQGNSCILNGKRSLNHFKKNLEWNWLCVLSKKSWSKL